MNIYDATEVAYKNGYEKGKADTVQEIQTRVAVHFGTYCEKDQVKIADVFKLIGQTSKEILEDI